MIKISVKETPVPDSIIFTEMQPWKGQAKTITHAIDGADFDIIFHTGRKSRSTTIKGYCKRSAENLAILDTLDNGDLLTIEHSVEGTRHGICTALQTTATSGGLFVTFSMTVVEQ